MDKNNYAVSLIEVILVMAILLLLITGAYFAFRGQIGKGNDAKRKDDLEMVRVAFEDYYNDNGCYPSPDMVDDCGSSDLSPYLREIPCDPVSGDPYKMIVDDYGEDACPTWFKVYSKMENTDDPSIVKLGCQEGCQIDGQTYHYGISSPNVYAGQVPAFSYTCNDGSEPTGTTSASCACDWKDSSPCGPRCDCFDGEKIECSESSCQGDREGKVCFCCSVDECP